MIVEYILHCDYVKIIRTGTNSLYIQAYLYRHEAPSSQLTELKLRPKSRYYQQLYGVYGLTIHILGLRIHILSEHEYKSTFLNSVPSCLQSNLPTVSQMTYVFSRWVNSQTRYQDSCSGPF
jgi:hypothetical protein